MPEGPEIWILSKAINQLFKHDRTISYGKHLFLLDKSENWYFGLTGKVTINDDELVKVEKGWLNGGINKYSTLSNELDHLGLDFMTSEEELLRKEVDKWRKSKKKLAGLMLDQTLISGIGVAWGSEILHNSGLRPEMKACEQDLSKLASSILYIREHIKYLYGNTLVNTSSTQNFIDYWFDNLYAVRTMIVYKKGYKIDKKQIKLSTVSRKHNKHRQKNINLTLSK